MNQYINDPYKYLEKMQNEKTIVIFKQEVKGFTMHSLYINLKLVAISEEKLYIKNPFFVANIRRGNSLIQDQQSLTFCRRGMVKLYDLERKYIEKELGHPLILSKYQEEVCQNILNPIKQVFKNNKIIHLYKLTKENGKQCQISYTHDNWVLATKNSTILFSKPDDLSIYSQRCSRAKLFAAHWMEIMKELNLENLKEFLKEHTLIGEYCGNPEQQDILRYPQTQLIFYAIVKNNSPEICLPVEKARQICQSYNLQFVKVDQVTLNSYESVLKQLAQWSQQIGEGLMEIEGEGAVIYAVTEDQETISINKLKTVEFQIYSKLRQLLKKLITKIKYNEDPQLNVELGDYFKEIQIIIKHYQPPQPILYYMSIAKLAFEDVLNVGIKQEQIKYGFINFLEEKQNTLKKKLNGFGGVKLNLFKKHVRIIIVTLPFYLDDHQLQNLKDKLDIQSIDSQFTNKNISQRAAQVIFLQIPKLPQNVTNEQELEEYLQNSELQYQDPHNVIFVFLGLNQQAFEQAIANLQSKEFQEKNPITKSLGIQVASAKPQSQQGMLQKWQEKVQLYFKDCQNNFPTRTFQLDNLDYQQLDAIIKQFELTEQVVIDDGEENGLKQNKENNVQKKIVIIYPLMIPGSGKSTLAQYLKQNYKDYPFYDIIADEITLQFQKNQLGENQDSMEDKFQKVFPFLKEVFLQEFHKKINEILSCEDKAVLFVDRNCVPNTLQSMIGLVKAMQYELSIKNGGDQVQIINLGLIFPTQEANITGTPFNIDYAITILNRLISRENHILLNDDTLLKAQLCVNSLTMFFGFKAKDFYYKKLHLDKVVPMTYPKDRFPLDKQDLQLAQDLITKCVGGQGQEFAQLVEHIQMIREKYQIPEFNIIEECQENNNRLSAVIKELLSS